MPYCIWFKDLNKDSIAVAGGKGANLGEMVQLGLPVPNGFAVTAQAYKEFMEKTGLQPKILKLLEGINTEDTETLQRLAGNIQKLILSVPLSEEMAEEIKDNYELLGAEKEAQDIVQGKEVFVAVRSSATAEDLPSIAEDEQVLVTINGKPVYQKMKEIYQLSLSQNNIQVPAMVNNDIIWQSVSQIYKHPAQDKNLYKITTVSGREITISKKHSLITLDEDSLTPKVMQVPELKGGEKVPAISTLPEINCPDDFVDVLDYVKGDDVVELDKQVYIKNHSTNWTIQRPLPRFIKFTRNFAYFLGIYAAEGSTYQTGDISVTNSDPKTQKRVKDFLDELGINKNRKINKHSIRVSCKSLVRFLHAVAGEPLAGKQGKGKLCFTKRVPNFVFGWKKDLIGEFLRGAFDGDGGIENSGIGYCSTSHLLIGGIVKLLEILNLEFLLRKRKGKGKWSDHFRLMIPNKCLQGFKSSVGFESVQKIIALQRQLEKYEGQQKYFQRLRTFTISRVLAQKIKREYENNLPKVEQNRAHCPSCTKFIQVTSYNKDQKRFYCRFCKKVYYESGIVWKEDQFYKHYDDKGRFIPEATPWNRGSISGMMSQREFAKRMDKLGLHEMATFFSGSVQWDTIKNIETMPYNGYVYDFTVPGVENFAAGVGGIITHNSASFAGQQATYLNVKGTDNVVHAVRACWASLFTARAIYYREKNKFEHSKVLISAVVQKMVNSEKSGIMFTVNPATNNPGEMVIEGIYGLGELIVGGEVTPDTYLVDKKSREIRKVEVRRQETGLFRNAQGQNEKQDIPKAEQAQQKLTEKEIKELGRLGKKLEEHYQKPQDVEWAIEKGAIFIVQTRAVTTFKPAAYACTDAKEVCEEEAKLLLRGETASRGVASGPVRIVRTKEELGKVQKGDILVAKMTMPDYVPAMQRAAAIVTDEGGMTSHAAIVSREMGIPCMVGTEHATETLKDGQIITVYASRGIVYAGRLAAGKAEESRPMAEKKQAGGAHEEILTATKIKVIMDLPDFAEKAAATGADGVGLVRLEIMIANGGIHPAEYVRQGKIEEYVRLLKDGIGRIARAFRGKPAWVRCSDMRSDEYRNLEGGEQEPKETDPMIGWHAIRRLLDEPEILKAEFQAIRELHYEGLKNVGVMLPFVINTDEVRKAKEIMRSLGLEPCKAIDFGVMIETPASCWIIEELCKEGISFVSFGTNDLTQLTLGIDRNNEKIAHLFDEMHPAVLGEIAKVIKVCRKYGVKTSICGQAGSRKEMAEFLVHQGIDSISANVDAVEEIRKAVADVERKVLVEKRG